MPSALRPALDEQLVSPAFFQNPDRLATETVEWQEQGLRHGPATLPIAS